MPFFRHTKRLTVAALSSLLFIGAAADDTSALEGKAAPEVSLKTVDGKPFKLSSLKGSVVVLDYWATWCPPCRKSLPHLDEIAGDKALADKGLKVFAINDGEDVPTVKKFLTENKYTFTVPMDPTKSFGKNYKVRGIPTTVIIDRDGKISNVFIGFGDGSAEKLKSTIEEVLAKNTQVG